MTDPICSDSYAAVHQRLRSHRGSAGDKPCTDCGKPAAHWSYNHSGVGEVEGTHKGRPTLYSTDLDQYEPRCTFCHRRLDRPKPPTPNACRKGHSLLGENLYTHRDKWFCRECRKQYMKTYTRRKG